MCLRSSQQFWRRVFTSLRSSSSDSSSYLGFCKLVCTSDELHNCHSSFDTVRAVQVCIVNVGLTKLELVKLRRILRNSLSHLCHMEKKKRKQISFDQSSFSSSRPFQKFFSNSRASDEWESWMEEGGAFKYICVIPSPILLILLLLFLFLLFLLSSPILLILLFKFVWRQCPIA